MSYNTIQQGTMNVQLGLLTCTNGLHDKLCGV